MYMQVLEVHWKGGRLYGSIEILQTPSGLLLWELYSQVRPHCGRVGGVEASRGSLLSRPQVHQCAAACPQLHRGMAPLPALPSLTCVSPCMSLLPTHCQGIRLGVSSRGWASLRSCSKSGAMYVEKDFELITFDFVTEPSTADAYLFPIQTRFRGARGVPNQAKAVQIAHLGHGVCSMDNVGRLPAAQVLAARISRLQVQEGGRDAGEGRYI